jgi:sphingomyelin phosphodiesterase 4
MELSLSSSPNGKRGDYTPSSSSSFGSSLNSSNNSSNGHVLLSCETDQDFETLIQSYDIPAACEALRRYLAVEVQSSLSCASSKQQTAQFRRRFYERFNQILDRIFGNDEISKRKYGGWLEYSMGEGERRHKRPSLGSIISSSSSPMGMKSTSRLSKSTTNTQDMLCYIDTLSTQGQALIRLLGSEEENGGSIFQFLFRISHPVEFKLELDMLPEQSKMSILSRSPYTSVLFMQLLHKPVPKQVIDVRHPLLLVSITELYFFYFLRRPVSGSCGPSSNPSSSTMNSSGSSSFSSGVGGGSGDGGSFENQRSSSLMDSLTDSVSFSSCSGSSLSRSNAVGANGSSDYHWRFYFQDGMTSLTKGNPYNVLLLQYLRTFLPDSQKIIETRGSVQRKILQHASLFLHILIEFWLRQNLIVFSDEPPPDSMASMDTIQITQHMTTTSLASPFDMVHTYTTYMAPSDDLLSSLLLTLIHLLSDSYYPARMETTAGTSSNGSNKSIRSQAGNIFGPSSTSSSYSSSSSSVRSGMALGGGTGRSTSSYLYTSFGTNYLTQSVTVLRRPLFEFFRLVFSRAPTGLAPTAFLAIVDVWLAYVQPWNCKAWSQGVSPSSSSSGRATGYTSAWESYVLANYHFYTTLLGGFVERAKELEFSSNEERNLSLLDRVLSVYNKDLVLLLRKAALHLEQQMRMAVPSSSSSIMSNSSQDLNNIKTITNDEEGLNSEQAHVLSYYCKTLGLEAIPVSLNGSFHRDAERIYDKLLSDSGYVSVVGGTTSEGGASPTTNVSNSSSSSSSNFYSTMGFGGYERYNDRILRLNRDLRRIFEISDAYVSSSSQARSASSNPMQHLESCEPSRDKILKHLITSEGIAQLQKGFRKCSPETIRYIGDPMLQPIRSYEIPFLVRLSYRFSTWLNQQLGLKNPYCSKDFAKNVHVDPMSSYVLFRFNFRFLASIPNLIYLFFFFSLLYLLYFW